MTLRLTRVARVAVGFTKEPWKIPTQFLELHSDSPTRSRMTRFTVGRLTYRATDGQFHCHCSFRNCTSTSGFGNTRQRRPAERATGNFNAVFARHIDFPIVDNAGDPHAVAGDNCQSGMSTCLLWTIQNSDARARARDSIPAVHFIS